MGTTLRKLGKLRDPEIRARNFTALRWCTRARWYDLRRPSMPDPVFLFGSSRSGATVSYETLASSPALLRFDFEIARFWDAPHGPCHNGWQSEAGDAGRGTAGALNRIENITVQACAASDRTGIATIHEGPSNHKGTSSLRAMPNATRSIEIPTVALDELVHAPQVVNLMKLDVEGAELLALHGASRLIETSHPRLIIEVTDSYLKSFSHSAAELLQWLIDRSYIILRIADDGLKPIKSTDDELPFQFNAVAVSKFDEEALSLLNVARISGLES